MVPLAEKGFGGKYTWKFWKPWLSKSFINLSAEFIEYASHIYDMRVNYVKADF